MSDPQHIAYRDTALALAQEAGAVLLGGGLRAQAAEEKGTPSDLVTRFDRAAEQVIVEGLRARHPGHRILAEEGGAEPGDEGAPRWIVDPIDGTTNFAHGLPLFTVSIACEEGGVVVAGVVAAPALGWTFSAVRGGGARRGEDPLRVSRTSVLERSLLATGFPYDKRTSPQNNLAEFSALELAVQGVRRLGSAALDLALVACGWLDGYWERKLKPWDLAAGVLLVEEAGGRVTDWQGGPLDLFRGEVAVSNGLIHDPLLAALRAAGKSVPLAPKGAGT